MYSEGLRAKNDVRIVVDRDLREQVVKRLGRLVTK